jgi:hypothetical protein
VLPQQVDGIAPAPAHSRRDRDADRFAGAAVDSKLLPGEADADAAHLQNDHRFSDLSAWKGPRDRLGRSLEGIWVRRFSQHRVQSSACLRKRDDFPPALAALHSRVDRRADRVDRLAQGVGVEMSVLLCRDGLLVAQ